MTIKTLGPSRQLRGLKFFPKPSRIDHSQLEADTRQFFRTMTLREFFHEEQEEGNDKDDIRQFKKISKWTPLCNRDPALETYVKAVRDDIHQSLDQGPQKRCRDSLTSKERKALRSLRLRSDIVIKPANKGLMTEVMSRQDYLTRVMKHLNNQDFYERLDEDPTNHFAEEITSFLTDMRDRHIIDEDTLNYLQPQNSWTPTVTSYLRSTRMEFRKDR